MTTARQQINWTREQLLVTFKLYCELPFGRMHSKNPEVIRIAGAIGRTPSAVAMKLVNIASLDPAIRLSGRRGLTGASGADKHMWGEMTSDWAAFSLKADAAFQKLHLAPADRDERDETGEPANFVGLTREANIAVRVGQALFRKSVLSAYDYKCCITGISIHTLLVASHIVPWKSDIQNRLNPRNGLCLSAIHDRAFDTGLISLAEDHSVILSKHIRSARNPFIEASFRAYEGKRITLPEKFLPQPEFLEYHRRKVFQS